MAQPRLSRAAGAPLALLIVLGALIGTIAGQPTIGVLVGFGTGVLIALALWWRDRPR